MEREEEERGKVRKYQGDRKVRKTEGERACDGETEKKGEKGRERERERVMEE